MGKKMHKGEQQKLLKKARNLLEQDMGITEVMEATGLSQQDIQREQQKMRK
ncbi:MULTISPECIES: hypothetical protein [Clostridium]|uniref:Transposase n=1 Tax=Clostridium senegalense TaxID=1465809 RepID=A0A6M0H4C7_9CLOT|nr:MULTISPECIES: hypothetical protein [Clostridium]MBU5225843.1 hypothetical protein [Clostridium senegalense]NEU05459.1 hypothetical protein [Clostridium senegalense]